MTLCFQNCSGGFSRVSDESSVSVQDLISIPDSQGGIVDELLKINIEESDIQLNILSSDQIELEWGLEDSSSVRLEYGISETNLDQIVVDDSFTLNRHTFSLEGLQPEREYFYRLSAKSISGIIYESKVFSFKLPQDNPLAETILIKSTDIQSEVNSDLATIEWDIGAKSRAFIEYGLDEKLGTVQYREESYKYSFHRQRIRNLESGATYFYQIHAVTLDGLKYKSGIHSLTTKKASEEPNIFEANYVDFGQFTQKEKVNIGFRGPDTFKEGNWEGVNGSTSPGGNINRWQRVIISPNKNNGSHRKFFLDPSIKEAWASFQIQLGTNWTPTDGVKLPGFSGHINEGSNGPAGGNGGGWAGLCKSWSARTLISKPSGANPGLYRMYVYHRDNTNFTKNTKASDHPCINKNNVVPARTQLRNFGQMVSGTSTITDHKWHTITQHIKLNDIGKANGIVELFIDGKPSGRGTNLNFTNNPKYHNIAFWFTIYHGGSADTSGTSHDVFFHGFNWNAGPVNKTKIKFD